MKSDTSFMSLASQGLIFMSSGMKLGTRSIRLLLRGMNFAVGETVFPIVSSEFYS